MTTPKEILESLSTEAKTLALFQFHGSTAAFLFRQNTFAGSVYDNAVGELIAKGVISLRADDKHGQIYDVLINDREYLSAWYVDQPENARSNIVDSMMCRVPDRSDVGIAVRTPGVVLDMAQGRHSQSTVDNDLTLSAIETVIQACLKEITWPEEDGPKQ